MNHAEYMDTCDIKSEETVRKKTDSNETFKRFKVKIVNSSVSISEAIKMSVLDGFLIKKQSPRALGLFLMAGAGFFLTVGNVLVQYVHKLSTKAVSSFQIVFIRSLIQLVLSLTFIFYGRVHLYGERKNIVTLLLMGITEVAAIVFVYFALERMPVGDATVIQFTAPVFTLAFSFLCLRRGCSVFDTICGLLSFVGVVVMTRPVLLFKGHVTSHHVINTLHHHVDPQKGITSKPGDPDYILGVGFALLAAVMLSAFFILNKMTGKNLDLTLTIFYPSLFGVLLSPAFQAAFHQPIYFENNWRIWCFLLLIGFVCFVGLMFMAEALQLEDAGPAVLVRNLDAVYAFILQYLILRNKPHWLSLVGGGIVLLATSLIVLNRTVFSKYDICQKKEIVSEYEGRSLLKEESTVD